MSQRCKTCDHPQRAAIDKALVNGTGTRQVAATFGVHRESVRYHAAHHLPERLKRAQTRQEAADDLDVFDELRRGLNKLTRFLEACEASFADPDDPDRYDLGPRAHEITVTYETQQRGRTVTRKAKLSELLAVAEERIGEGTITMVETRSADTRELFLKTFARMQPTLELLGKLTGEVPTDGPTVVLWQSPDWLAVQEALRRALDRHPDVQEAVFRELEAISA